MKVTVVVVGRVRGPLRAAVEVYEERAARYWKIEVVEVDGGAGGSERPEHVMDAEAERLLARIPAQAGVVALTREAKGMSSRGLSRWLGRAAVRSESGVCFLIGGAYGLHSRVLERADRQLSLSPMTLPHEMARLLLAEQLYRAGTIVRGEPYHKGT